MSFFVGRDGNISILRVGMVIGVLGAVVIVGGFLLFQLEQRSFNAPLNVDIFPGAVERIPAVDLPGNNRQIVYQTEAPPEEVATFYDQQLAEFNDTSFGSLDRDRCNRYPVDGVFEEVVEGDGRVPYYYRCLFNDSGWNGALRWTQIDIQPGVLNNEATLDTRGLTIIIYEQHWD